jgi:hypothetical protein
MIVEDSSYRGGEGSANACARGKHNLKLEIGNLKGGRILDRASNDGARQWCRDLAKRVKIHTLQKTQGWALSLFRDEPAHVFEQNQEVQGICRGGDEIKMFVKSAGLFVFGMDGQSAYPGDLGCLQSAQHRVP